MTKMMKTYALVLGTIMYLAGCNQNNSDLDKIELQNLDGTTVNMRDFENRIVFINFWATWCKPCILEMPTIAKAQDKLKDENVVFLFPSNEDVDLINTFKEKRGFDFNFMQVVNMEALNILALPTTYIFNSDGKRIFSEAGYRDWSTPENLALILDKN